jgi:hypothetical protein
MKTRTFEPSKLTSITLTHGTTNHRYYWQEPKQIRYFFGLIPTNRYTSGGYRDSYSGFDTVYTIEDLMLKDAYRIEKDNTALGGYLIFQKPYLRACFEGGSYIDSWYETDEEAMTWITEMLGKSDRKFELVHIID